MTRRTLERRRAAKKLWPNLGSLLGGYFHEDWPIDYGSVDGVLAKAPTEVPLEFRKLIIREWYDWQTKEGTNNEDLRQFVQDGFGVNVHFKKPIDARNFMNQVHDRIIESVRHDLGEHWRP